MNKEEINEIVKAMAYGSSDEDVAEECEMSVEAAAAFRAEYADKIAAKVGECHE